MKNRAVALVAMLLSTAANAHHLYSYTTEGPALRTTHAGLPQWAAAPTPYALGSYASGHAGTLHGTSTARESHIARLRTCNPFSNVSATKPLTSCN